MGQHPWFALGLLRAIEYFMLAKHFSFGFGQLVEFITLGRTATIVFFTAFWTLDKEDVTGIIGAIRMRIGLFSTLMTD